MKAPAEIVFKVTEAAEGGFDARALGYSIFTQGDDWTDLKATIKDAVICHFGCEVELRVVGSHFIWDESPHTP
ncbi:MAG: 2-oxoisovalerate dehydrogenase [Chloroflexi bacterium]|nr:2-oxoisovalerate dehydrogenase [Chloroflexota bacterium]